MTANRTLGLFVSLSFVIAYHSGMEAQEDDSKDSQVRIVSKDSSVLSTLWKNARNAKDSSLLELYTQDAIKIDSNDSIWTGPAEIFGHYRSQSEISFVLTAHSIDANIYRGISYEINLYKPKDAPVIAQLVIYETRDNQKIRAFEYEATRPILNPEGIPEEISKQLKDRRDQWMAYCNAHQVEDLVNDLYSEHTMYFNHRPLVKGRTALIKEYSYMNSEQYELTLVPKYQAFVNDSTVFEIGQCKGSYNGKYILIWKKEDDGQWRIFVDSNI